jgi:hypothetical protein
MAASERTTGLLKEFKKRLRDSANYRKTQPKPTWDSSSSNLGPIGFIDKLIKNSEVGSPKRQAYIDEKNAYLKKSEEWQKKADAYSVIANKAQLAYQASVALDSIEKKWQDNKDTGVKDTKLDAKVEKLKGEIKTYSTETVSKEAEQGIAVPAFDPNTATKTDNFDDPKFTGWATYKSSNGSTIAVWRKNGKIDPDNKGDIYYYSKEGKWYDSKNSKVYITEAMDKAKQEEDAKAAAKIKAKQEADAKAAALKKKTGTSGVTPAVTPAVDREAQALDEAAKADFDLPQTLFDNIPSLKLLLEKYVKTPGMTMDAFRKELRNDLWFKQNSQEIKERFVQYYNFRDLQTSGRAQGTTDYEMQIDKIEENLKRRAVEIGSSIVNSPNELRKKAEELYITNKSEDANFVDKLLSASIERIAGTIGGRATQGYSGQALGNYNKLVEAARDNGFQLSDIIPGGATEQQVLQGISAGTIDINRVVEDARKLAMQGQPAYVRDLLAQGYTLKQILAPYRQTMANVLEIQDPEEINLNDPLLRSAISDKGDMNMYEFKKALRRDNRWQYTEQARADVSNAALGVLRDFGFQG